MKKANELFLLQKVGDNVLWDSENSTQRTIDLYPTSKSCKNRLQLVVGGSSKDGVTLGYEAIRDGDRVSQSPSDPAPINFIVDIIGKIAQDIFPL